MIKFHNIAMQNFFSYGNVPTTFNLDGSTTTLICGANGTGKSTIIDAICFALFGKAFRNINKSTVINTINNKACLVSCTFSVGLKSYKVDRGLKPNIFNIFEDGVLLEQSAASKDYQKLLEENILQLNYKTFTQIAILSNASFVPFMQLPAADRRFIIEDLLDIKVFTAMSKIAKEKMSANNQALFSVENDIDNKKSNVQTLTNFIEKIKREESEKDNEIGAKIIALEAQIENLSVGIGEKENAKTALYDAISDASEIGMRKTQVAQAVVKMESAQSSLVSERKFYAANDTCPTCKQSIEMEFKQNRLIYINESINKRNVALNSAKETIDAYVARQLEFDVSIREIRELDSELSTINSNISNLNWQINHLKTEQNKVLVSLDKERADVKRISKEIVELIKEKDILVETKQYLDIAAILLKDTGIKSSIVQQYIPVLNHFINYYLGIMNFFVRFDFDNNFTETIRIRERDTLSYYNLSEGQKKRVDLAILFAFRKISEAKNICNTNILFFDEVLDSSLDADGLESIANIFESFGDKNIFVISHRDSALDIFDKQIKVQLINNYSHISVNDN